MISGTYMMVRQSERVRAHCDELEENGDVLPPTPVNW